VLGVQTRAEQAIVKQNGCRYIECRPTRSPATTTMMSSNGRAHEHLSRPPPSLAERPVAVDELLERDLRALEELLLSRRRSYPSSASFCACAGPTSTTGEPYEKKMFDPTERITRSNLCSHGPRAAPRADGAVCN